MGRPFFVVFILGLMIAMGSSRAQTLPTVGGITAECQRSYRADSYGRGLEAGFTGVNLQPSFADSLCYALGVKVGRETRLASCSGDFTLGLERGRALHAIEIGSACYNAGYQAGRASFRTGARENDSRLASATCIRIYRAAYDDGFRRIGNAVPSRDRVLAECYREGYADGEWFQIEGSDFFPF